MKITINQAFVLISNNVNGIKNKFINNILFLNKEKDQAFADDEFLNREYLEYLALMAFIKTMYESNISFHWSEIIGTSCFYHQYFISVFLQNMTEEDFWLPLLNYENKRILF